MTTHKLRRENGEHIYCYDTLLWAWGKGEEMDRDFPSENGEVLWDALYDYIQCTDDPIEDGDAFELDGKIIGHRQSVHFIPVEEVQP